MKKYSKIFVFASIVLMVQSAYADVYFRGNPNQKIQIDLDLQNHTVTYSSCYLENFVNRTMICHPIVEVSDEQLESTEKCLSNTFAAVDTTLYASALASFVAVQGILTPIISYFGARAIGSVYKYLTLGFDIISKEVFSENALYDYDYYSNLDFNIYIDVLTRRVQLHTEVCNIYGEVFVNPKPKMVELSSEEMDILLNPNP